MALEPRLVRRAVFALPALILLGACSKDDTDVDDSDVVPADDDREPPADAHQYLGAAASPDQGDG